MGGTMGVDSEPGQGSTFWCEIPFEPPVGTSSAPVTAGPGLRVLTIGTDPGVDDDLRRWTMTVTTAAGTAALDQLRDAAGHGLPFDVMLIDADADPGDVDIRGLARLVTADDTIPAVHIVVLNDKGLESDIGTYLPKPVSRSALYDLLAQSRVVTAASVGPASAPPADRGHLLLVEDNDINQMVATGILTSLGYHTDVASNGAQAVDMARATDYDAILMDCRMPVMDGFTATAELRQLEAGTDRHTPIIAMTASALVADRERCLAAGMDDYLAKPVNPSELDAALHRWITQPAVVRPSPAAPGRDTRPAPAPSRAAALPSSVGPAPSHRASAPNAGTTPAPELVPPAVDAPLPSASSHRGSSPHFEPTSDWDGRERRQPASGRPDAVLAPDRRTPSADHDSDPIGQRLDELAGDRSGPELALVNRLVESFLQRAPLHLTALTDAFNAASPKAVEDEAHTLKGAAGNVGALAVMDICARIEDDARARTLTNGTADDMRRLRLELERVDHRLRAVVAQ
jgi:CheY-like chemotaxis protein/HPt (histidine-containing phosphotransfer) domain-containing protein